MASEPVPFHSGYIVKDPIKQTFGHLASSKRRFMVLHVNGLISYYETEEKYKLNPSCKKGQLLMTSFAEVGCLNEIIEISVNFGDKLVFRCASITEASEWFRQIKTVQNLLIENGVMPPPVDKTPRRTRIQAIGKLLSLPSNPIFTKKVVNISQPAMELKSSEDSNKFCKFIWDGDLVNTTIMLRDNPKLISQIGCIFSDADGAAISPAAQPRRPSDNALRETLIHLGSSAKIRRDLSTEASANVLRRGYPVALAAEKGHTEILNLLLKAGGVSERRRMSRMSLINNNWVDRGLRESFGFHPAQIDRNLRETFSKLQLDGFQRAGGEGGADSALTQKYLGIMVDRRGALPNSHMTTVSIVSEIFPEDSCKVKADEVPAVPPALLIRSEHKRQPKKSAKAGAAELEKVQEGEEEEEEEDRRKSSTDSTAPLSTPAEEVDLAERTSVCEQMRTTLVRHSIQRLTESATSADARTRVRRAFSIEGNAVVYDTVDEEDTAEPATRPGFVTATFTSAAEVAGPDNICNHLSTEATSSVHYLEFPYTWNIEQLEDAASSNIFGENSYLECDFDVLRVPVNACTAQNMEYFNCLLLDTHSPTFRFEIPVEIEAVPLTLMSVGENYVEGFIMQDSSNDGCSGMGGAYLEWHDVPHFHMPVSPSARGYLVVGKLNPNNCTIQLAGFHIPYGRAVYMKPYTLHNDCFLIGDYQVMYSATDNFATGTVVNRQRQYSRFEFFNPLDLRDPTVLSYSQVAAAAIGGVAVEGR